mmetsp:Transcript_57732/g.108183  ORF Transcript_57732/g.108183 Transcript_57732/m.108183 type:complete len:255 (+) Transcript_57732:54-818(+)
MLLVAVALLSVVRAAEPPCATKGVAYKDPAVARANGGRPYDALACQMYCAADPACSIFTYYQHNKACWLLGDKATVAPVGTGAVSGPSDCAHLLPGGGTPTGPNPLSKYPDVVVKSEKPVIRAREVGSETAGLKTEPDQSSRSSFWALLFGGVALVLMVGAVLVYCITGERKARTKRGTEVLHDRTGPRQDYLPLVQQGASTPNPPLPVPQLPIPQLPPVWVAPTPVPQYFSQQMQMQAPVFHPNYRSNVNAVF